MNVVPPSCELETDRVPFVSSVGDALVGKDCVKIGGGSFTLMSGKDGVASSNEDDADRGFVSIDVGSFSIDADDDGVHAECGLSVSGGTVDVVSSIEGLEGQSISVSGGGCPSFRATTAL